MAHNIYLKNKSGATLHQVDTGLVNDWLDGTVINASTNHHHHQLFPINKLRILILAGDVAITEDAEGTIEKGLNHSLEYFEAASLASIDDAFENDITMERVNQKGISGGYASLDATGRIPSSQLPSGLGGGVTYKGTWDANANTPTLVSSVGTDGDMYKISVAGTTNIDGESSWAVGDQIIFGDGVWSKIDNTESITSVHGRTGAVVGQAGDYTKDQVGLDQVDNTSDLNKPISTSTQTALDTKEVSSNKGVANGYAGLDALGNIPDGNIGADLDVVMENGSTSNVSTPIDIQTTASMNLQSSGAYSASGSSTSLTSVGSATQGFYEEVASASIPNGAQITHGTTVKVTSNTAVYDSEMTDDSFARKKWIEDEIASATASAGAGGVLGDVKSSMLTEGQMSTLTSDWVLADGRNVTGSAYATLTGKNVIPDLRGQFLRGLDTSGTTDPNGAGRTLGDSQSDETAINSLSLNVRTHSSNGLYHDRTQQIAGASDYAPAEYESNAALRGGDETRPTNVSVNYFIKVN